jgi:Calcineurin-like phosphoesterase
VAKAAHVILLLLALACGKPAPSAPARVVAIGDLHGDVEAARAALRLAGAIDDADHWIGGKLVVVQTGDQLDRGDTEREILDLFDRLRGEAARAGGAFIALNGNHELMNVAGDLRYVTPGGMAEFGGEAARTAAFTPGGDLAKRLAERPIYAIVGDTVFVHGGVLPDHAARLEALDQETRAWMRGERAEKPAALTDEQSPLWTRRYGRADDPGVCSDAAAALARLHLRRMVVAHTVQEGGMSAICDGKVWRIDVGLAKLYGGPLQVLELRGASARVLTR